MATLLVPHTIATDYVRVWLGALDVPAPPNGLQLTLMPGAKPIHVAQAAWTRVDAAGLLPNAPHFVQVLQICDLTPGTRYLLSRDGEDGAFFHTLPAHIPTAHELPFSLFLGSCFFQGQDIHGRVGAAFKGLPTPYAPRLKLLTGDQVYLDLAHNRGLPIAHILSETDYARHSLEKYRRTWLQREPSFQTLLRSGGAFLTADDHEFWNNCPNPQLQLPGTWRGDTRRAWRRIACSLFEDFQSDVPLSAGSPRAFQIGRLSFFLVDTRIDREAGDEAFMRPSDFDRLIRWLNASSNPGVLVIGQPLFQSRSNWFMKRVADRTLANYAQYDELVRAIGSCDRSLLVLSGDVHYGRVATVIRPGRQLHEVIASPLSLLSGKGDGHGEAAPTRFPSDAISGVQRFGTQTHYRTGKEHFAILSISSRGGRITVYVRYWFTKPSSDGSVCSRAIGPLYLD